MNILETTKSNSRYLRIIWPGDSMPKMVDNGQSYLSLLLALKIIIWHMFMKYTTLLKIVCNINLVKLVNGKNIIYKGE